MFSRIHEKLGTAGFVISIVALVAAMAGGAYAAGALSPAAKKQITKESKKFSKKFSKQFAMAGPQGAKGDTGAQGAKGDPGAKGDAGSPGTNGTNGTDGEDGMCSEAKPECLLPSGATSTGTWGVAGGNGDYAMATISFPLRVSPAPTAIGEGNGEAFGHTLGFELQEGKAPLVGPYKSFLDILAAPSPPTAAEEDEEAFRALCPGSASEPEAEPGFLCIYIGDKEGDLIPPNGEELASLSQPATESGVAVIWETNTKGFIRGTWAVTE